MTEPKKYLFSENVFDEPEEEEIEEYEEPPPPTFSEEELEQARKETYDLAYQKGYEDGRNEVQESLEKKVSDILAAISAQAGLIFANESTRDDIFEQEVITLTSAILKKVFPVFMHKYGEDEFKNTLSKVLKGQSERSEIHIEVMPGTTENISEKLSQISLKNQITARFNVEENASLSENACILKWKDGGAIRDIENLAQKILDILETNTEVPQTTNPEHDILEKNTEGLSPEVEVQKDEEETHIKPHNQADGDLRQADVIEDIDTHAENEKHDQDTIEQENEIEAEQGIKQQIDE